MEPGEYQRAVELRSRRYHSLAAVPSGAFPLFITSRQYLLMLDGATADPMFARREDGSIIQVKHAAFLLVCMQVVRSLCSRVWCKTWTLMDDALQKAGGMRAYDPRASLHGSSSQDVFMTAMIPTQLNETITSEDHLRTIHPQPNNTELRTCIPFISLRAVP